MKNRLANTPRSESAPTSAALSVDTPPDQKRGGMVGLAERLIASRRHARFQDWALLPILVVVFIIGAVASPTFFTASNLFHNVLQQSAALAIVVVAESLLLISGKFDVSLESIVGLAPMVGALLIVSVEAGGLGLHISPYVAILIVLAVGALIGVVNGALVIRLNLNSFIITFAMLILWRGITLGLTSGQSLSALPSQLLYLGSAEWFGVPISVWLFIAVFVVAELFLRLNPLGRAVYAIGGNPSAARATGLNVNRIGWGIYIVAGLMAAVAGLVLTGRIAAVTAAQGNGLIFSVLAVAVLGGVSLDGGRGRMTSVLIATLLLAAITNILVLLQVPSFWIDAAYGAIILVTLAVSKLGGRKDGAGRKKRGGIAKPQQAAELSE
jgi:simple sugar transport system permease protein